MNRRRWQVPDRVCVDQVANACDAYADLSPASDAPAAAVRAAWDPLRSGQTVPLIWERTTPDAEPCDDC